MFSFKYLGILVCCLVFTGLTGCGSAPITQGTLAEDVYASSIGEFSLTVPTEAVLRDGNHPLGGYLTLSNLPAPTLRKGVSYYRAASPVEGLNDEQAKGIILSGHADFLRNMAEQGNDAVIYDEWSETNDSLIYFSVVEGSSPGFLVKPGAYYGAYSLIAGNHSYVFFEAIEAPYQLKGAEDSPERLAIKNPENRLSSIKEFFDTLSFHKTTENRFLLED